MSNTPLLIAISGPQGCGKSTTIAALSHYPTVQRKTSRSILSDWGVSLSEVNNNRELTLKFQDEILKRKSYDEAVALADAEAAGHRVVITERSYADLFTYALVAIGKDNEYSEWINDYYTKCVEQQQQYSGIYYLSAGHFAPVHDGVRATNMHYQQLVDISCLHFSNEMVRTDVVVRCIDQRSVEDRINAIEADITYLLESQDAGELILPPTSHFWGKPVALG